LTVFILIADAWSVIESGNFSHVPLMIGFNKDEGLMGALTIHEKDEVFQELSSRWENELCPVIAFHRYLL
jgi:hypothetical protein